MRKPTEAQLLSLKWLELGGKVLLRHPHPQTKRVLLDAGWVTDDGDDLHLTDVGRRVLEEAKRDA